eukprot:SAG11_NODE_2754_length_3007_cov_10.651307_6_plen_161_part_00
MGGRGLREGLPAALWRAAPGRAARCAGAERAVSRPSVHSFVRYGDDSHTVAAGTASDAKGDADTGLRRWLRRGGEDIDYTLPPMQPEPEPELDLRRATPSVMMDAPQALAGLLKQHMSVGQGDAADALDPLSSGLQHSRPRRRTRRGPTLCRSTRTGGRF